MTTYTTRKGVGIRPPGAFTLTLLPARISRRTSFSRHYALGEAGVVSVKGRSRKGSMTGTSVGWKCRTLRVATVRPCSKAVAAMSKSALSWPRVWDRRPQRRAEATSTERMWSPYSVSTLSNQAAQGACKRRIAVLLAGYPPLHLPHRHHAQVEVRRPLGAHPCQEVGVAFPFPQRRQHVGIEKKHQTSTARKGNGNRSNSSSSCGMASIRSANNGACACSRCRKRSYSSTASTTTAGLPRRVTRCGARRPGRPQRRR